MNLWKVNLIHEYQKDISFSYVISFALYLIFGLFSLIISIQVKTSKTKDKLNNIYSQAQIHFKYLSTIDCYVYYTCNENIYTKCTALPLP